MSERYELNPQIRATLESLNVPLAIYQSIDHKLATLLVSDGLLALQAPDQTREGLVYQFDHDMFCNVEPDDASKVVQQSVKFAREGGHYTALYRERLYGKDEYAILFANGDHVYTPEGIRLAFVWYTDVTAPLSEGDHGTSEFHDVVRDFFRKSTSAMAVVSQKGHGLRYYNEAICRMLPPQFSDDIGRTFEEFFFGDASDDSSRLFEQIDMGVHEFVSPVTHQRLEASVSSTYWQDEPAFLVYVYDVKGEGDASGGEASAEERATRRRLRRSRAFAQFLQTGESNDLPYDQTGYKGFFVWNLTSDELVRCGGVPYLSKEDEKAYTYEAHRRRMEAIVERQEGDEQIKRYTTDFFLEKFESRDYPRQMELSYRVNGARLYVHTDFSMMESPDTGDVYLKVQNENITARNVTDTLLQTLTTSVCEFVAYLDMLSDQCVVLDGTGERREGRLSGMAYEIGQRIGQGAVDAEGLVSYLERQCGDSSEGVALCRVGDKVVKDLRVQALSREDRRYFISCMDISESAGFEGSGYFDALTGLGNMMGLRREAPSFLNHVSGQAAVTYFNLMSMKAYNDKYGYEEGDALLKNIAKVLSTYFDDSFLARIADDHFLVVGPAANLEDRIAACHAAIFESSHGFFLKAGVCLLEEGIDLIAACDHARLAFKTIRNRYDVTFAYYEEKINEEYARRHYIVENFDRALQEDWIKLYYQPVVDAKTGTLRHMEGLCRWIDPEMGMISPGDFIPVLEDYHLITLLDFYMVERMCEQFATREGNTAFLGHGNPVPVSLNFSGIDFDQTDLSSQLADIMDRAGIAREFLVVEITESALAAKPEVMRHQIDRLHEAGFEVWMDDFGSGYSSLGSLKDYDFDVVKFDMQFVSDIEDNARSRSILSSLMELCRHLGMKIVSEGVETANQLEILRSMECDLIQGYLVCRPIPLADLRERLSGFKR